MLYFYPHRQHTSDSGTYHYLQAKMLNPRGIICKFIMSSVKGNFIYTAVLKMQSAVDRLNESLKINVLHMMIPHAR